MYDLEKNPNPLKDQHFLMDEEILQKIYDVADIQDGESIVEIGGGSGAITDYLVRGNNHVTVIEKDPYFAEYLRRKYSSCSNVTVIEGDALDFNYSDYDRLVANLPFTISEPLLVNLASSGALDYNQNQQKGSRLKSITLVLSQNTTRKMVAPIQLSEGNSKHINQEFGLMGAIAKTFCDVEVVGTIASEAFFPEPAVTSFLVNLTPKKEKTTVDRIMKELLVDKKNNRATIKRIYQLLIVQEKVYKQSKHKNLSTSTGMSFTSKNIEDKNIYELTNSQLSQLIQDLIRNDINMKSKNRTQRRQSDDYSRFFVGNRFVYSEDDMLDEDENEEEIFASVKEKFQRKYDYLYDSALYEMLLRRGLEYDEDLQLKGSSMRLQLK